MADDEVNENDDDDYSNKVLKPTHKSKEIIINESPEKSNVKLADAIPEEHVTKDYKISSKVANSTETFIRDDKDEKSIKSDVKTQPRSACRSRSRDVRRCQKHFQEMIGKHEMRNVELERREVDLRQRLDVCQCAVPAVMVYNIMRMAKDGRCSAIRRLLDKQFQGYGGDNIAIPCTPSQHFDSRVRELEAQRKKELRRAEEARAILVEKEAALEERRKRLEEARKHNQESKEKIEKLSRQAAELKEALKNAWSDDNSCQAGECGEMRCKEEWLKNVGSVSSIGSADLECFAKLEELAEAEHCMKRQISELEHREEAYMRTLQQADEMWSKTEGDTADAVSQLQDQLDSKNAANQQLADRICQLEDELETIKKKLISCKGALAEYTDKKMIEDEAGLDDAEATVTDRATVATIATKSVASVAAPSMVNRDTLARPETMDEESNITPDSVDEGINATAKTSEKESGAIVVKINRGVERPADLGINMGVGDGQAEIKEPKLTDKAVSARKTVFDEDTETFVELTDRGTDRPSGFGIEKGVGDEKAQEEEEEEAPANVTNLTHTSRVPQVLRTQPTGIEDKSDDEDISDDWKDSVSDDVCPAEYTCDNPEGIVNASKKISLYTPAATTIFTVDINEIVGPTPETDQITLSRDQLRNWYNIVDSVHHMISKCDNCSSQMDSTAQLAEQMKLYLKNNGIAGVRGPMIMEELRKYPETVSPLSATSTVQKIDPVPLVDLTVINDEPKSTVPGEITTVGENIDEPSAEMEKLIPVDIPVMLVTPDDAVNRAVIEDTKLPAKQSQMGLSAEIIQIKGTESPGSSRLLPSDADINAVPHTTLLPHTLKPPDILHEMSEITSPQIDGTVTVSTNTEQFVPATSPQSESQNDEISIAITENKNSETKSTDAPTSEVPKQAVEENETRNESMTEPVVEETFVTIVTMQIEDQANEEGLFVPESTSPEEIAAEQPTEITRDATPPQVPIESLKEADKSTVTPKEVEMESGAAVEPPKQSLQVLPDDAEIEEVVNDSNTAAMSVEQEKSKSNAILNEDKQAEQSASSPTSLQTPSISLIDEKLKTNGKKSSEHDIDDETRFSTITDATPFIITSTRTRVSEEAVDITSTKENIPDEVEQIPTLASEAETFAEPEEFKLDQVPTPIEAVHEEPPVTISEEESLKLQSPEAADMEHRVTTDLEIEPEIPLRSPLNEKELKQPADQPDGTTPRKPYLSIAKVESTGKQKIPKSSGPCICKPRACPMLRRAESPKPKQKAGKLCTEATQISAPIPRTAQGRLDGLKLKTIAESTWRSPDVGMRCPPLVSTRRPRDKSMVTTVCADTQTDSALVRERIALEGIARKDDCTCSGVSPRNTKFGGRIEGISFHTSNKKRTAPIPPVIYDSPSILESMISCVEKEIAVIKYTGRSLVQQESELNCVECGRPITPDGTPLPEEAYLPGKSKSQKRIMSSVEKATSSESHPSQKKDQFICCECKTSGDVKESREKSKTQSINEENVCCPCPTEITRTHHSTRSKLSRKKRKPEKKDQGVMAFIPKKKSIKKSTEVSTVGNPISRLDIKTSKKSSSHSKSRSNTMVAEKTLASKVASSAEVSECGCNGNSSVNVPYKKFGSIFKAKIVKGESSCSIDESAKKGNVSCDCSSIESASKEDKRSKCPELAK